MPDSVGVLVMVPDTDGVGVLLGVWLAVGVGLVVAVVVPDTDGVGVLLGVWLAVGVGLVVAVVVPDTDGVGVLVMVPDTEGDALVVDDCVGLVLGVLLVLGEGCAPHRQACVPFVSTLFMLHPAPLSYSEHTVPSIAGLPMRWYFSGSQLLCWAPLSMKY